MSKVVSVFLLSIFLVACDPADLQRALDTLGESTTLTDAEVSSGLKEALHNGVGSAVDYLSQTDGYYKTVYRIVMPEEAQNVINKLKVIPGFESVEEEIILKVNRAAELAASKAKPIFVDAIKQMTFRDVWDILMGEQNAATTYLYDNTYSELYREFRPVIVESLNQYGALDYWTSLVNKYNSLPFVKKVNPYLEDHITKKALYGMFDMVEKKELAIRTDFKERTSDLLRKVFAKQDK
jgi:hypothetical protein